MSRSSKSNPSESRSHPFEPRDEQKPARRSKLCRGEPKLIRVAKLNKKQIENVWSPDLYKIPRDRDVFVRCQKIVISYCMYYGSDISNAGSPEVAYKRAREIARPLAALAARIPLTPRELAKNGFWIYDALRSWADAKDEGAYAVAMMFLAYAIPRHDKTFRDVEL